MSIEEDPRLMKTLGDAWNFQDWDTFEKRHANHVGVFWPGRPETLWVRGVIPVESADGKPYEIRTESTSDDAKGHRTSRFATTAILKDEMKLYEKLK